MTTISCTEHIWLRVSDPQPTKAIWVSGFNVLLECQVCGQNTEKWFAAPLDSNTRYLDIAVADDERFVDDYVMLAR